MNSDSLIIIPTYNEKENIEVMIETVLNLKQKSDFHILFVDDGSPDGTALIIEKLQKKYKKRLHLLKRNKKLGLGTAYIKGFKWALEREYKFIFEMDCDFSHDPNDLPRLYEQSKKHKIDVVIGSRYISGVNVVNWPISRVLMSYYASVYVRSVLGISIRDATAGFICYRREVLEQLKLDNIKFKGYCFQIEMKYKSFLHGFKIVEIPVIFTDRKKGKSKMNSYIFREALFGVLEMKIKNIFSTLI